MKDSKSDQFDAPTAVNNSDYDFRGAGDFGFAFNDSNFSDRVLVIEIVPDSIESTHDLADWDRNRKRRREDVKIDVDIAAGYPEEQVLNQPELPDDGVDTENQDEEPFVMIEESPSDGSYLKGTMEGLTVGRFKTLHISSPILAARSPFFYKLFSNGMRESEQQLVKLRINASEEASLMELLNFMYSNNLTVTTAPALLDVLMIADKFEVVSCMRYCSHLLRNLPMTTESALVYLDLCSSPLMSEAVLPLTVAAQQFLAVRYKDLSKFEDEIHKWPLVGMEAIISSDDLQVASEDTVYDFVLKWARAKYPEIEDRRWILETHLAKHIRFSYMTCRKLRKVMTCPDFDQNFAQKVVIEALFFKADAPHRQRAYITDGNYNINHRLTERAYKYWPVKVVEFERPRPQCVVYLDLKHEECASLFPSGRVYSQAFHLGSQGFFLSAHCNMDQQNPVPFPCFGLFLGMQERKSVSYVVDYDFSARSKAEEKFVSKYKGTYVFTGGKAVGYRNLFACPWTSFIGEDSHYFLDGVLHLRAELTLKN